MFSPEGTEGQFSKNRAYLKKKSLLCENRFCKARSFSTGARIINKETNKNAYFQNFVDPRKNQYLFSFLLRSNQRETREENKLRAGLSYLIKYDVLAETIYDFLGNHPFLIFPLFWRTSGLADWCLKWSANNPQLTVSPTKTNITCVCLSSNQIEEHPVGLVSPTKFENPDWFFSKSFLTVVDLNVTSYAGLAFAQNSLELVPVAMLRRIGKCISQLGVRRKWRAQQG